ncbi:XPB/Ssl2-like helicase family protein [Brevibacterium jeotgali]|nr:XPB/Ssl2-like helicase family protein [Brevibacterium jeotgali]
MGRMPESPSFAAWLRTAPEPWFRAFAANRTDLLRTDVTDVARLAALAASQAAVARGLESLDAPALRVVHRAAVLARITPAVDRSELLAAAEGPAPVAALTAAMTAGLVWPAAGADDPAAASAYRVQPEAGALLPVTAAARATPQPWESAADPRPLRTATVSNALLENAQGAGVAGAVSRALTVVAEFSDHDVSQLVSGGVGKRDAQSLARAAGTDTARFALLVELASSLGWLATTRDPADPQWKPTAEFDTAASSPREQVWTDLVTTWLTHPVDIAHVLAGSTPAGERIHLLGRDEHARTAFGGFPASRPQILTLRRLVLVSLLREGEGRALSEEDVVVLLSFTHPLLSAVRPNEVAQVLAEAESFGLTASPLGHADAHALTPVGQALAEWIAAVDDPFDVLGSSPVDAQGLTAGPPAALREQIAALLPPLEATVTLQSDLTGVAFGPLDQRVRLRLERIADVDTRGQGTVYRFTDASVTRALRTGESVESILAVLQETSATGVPTTLEHLVHAAGARLHRIRVARARSVVVVDDPTDLDVLLDDPVASAIGLRRLAPTVAVADASSDRVSALLETEDRPILRIDPDAEDPAGARAPVPSRAAPPTTRTTRVPAARIEAHINGLDAARAQSSRTGSPDRRRTSRGMSGASAAGRGATSGSSGGAGASGNATGNATGNAAGNTGTGAAVGQEAAAGADGDAQTVLAELGEAAAVSAPIDVILTTTDGTQRTVRMVPQSVSGGRVLGRTDAGKALRISVARIVRVRRSGSRDDEGNRHG